MIIGWMRGFIICLMRGLIIGLLIIDLLIIDLSIIGHDHRHDKGLRHMFNKRLDHRLIDHRLDKGFHHRLVDYRLIDHRGMIIGLIRGVVGR
jgi:hypothetical protein